jgi:predicted secreted protein
MTPWSIVAIYFVVWWIVLFAVLPFGVRTQEEAGNVTLGTSSSAPVRPRLIRTVIATTILAAVIVGGMVVAFDVYGISLETFAKLLDVRRQ